jgi:hypothetical protein
MMIVRSFLVAAGLSVALSAGAAADDRHAGYYYTKNVTNEVYKARAKPLKGFSRFNRLGFVTGVINKLIAGPYPPPYAMFAKGSEAEKLIIVGMGDYVQSLYQARALLAMLSAQARTTPVFRKLKVEDKYTFFDLAFMMGFKQVTISDGKTFSHQIKLQ